MDIYTSQGTIDACGLTGHRMHPVKALEEFRLGTFQVLPFDVEHDVPEPLGSLLTSMAIGEKLLYFTDTYFVRYRFTGLTHIMAKCNYSREGIQRSVEAGYIPIERVPRLNERPHEPGTPAGYAPGEAAPDLSPASGAAITAKNSDFGKRYKSRPALHPSDKV